MFDDQFSFSLGNPNAQGADGSGFDMELFEKNMSALSYRSPQAASAIRAARSSDAIRFIETDEGVETVELDGVAMGSKRRPMSEAEKFAGKFDATNTACCAVVGFAMGYHCPVLLESIGHCGIVVCFEPDAALLRSVFGRVDYTALFSSGRFYLVTDAQDSATLSQMFNGIEAVVGLGVEILYHPPSKARLAQSGGRFGEALSDVMRAARTHVVTALANSQISFRNLINNLDHYTTSAGIASLKDSCVGKAAVVVSAGPSLERNLDQLGEPGVRDSVVIIAVQTVLKQMLARGIKPHFVAALDYHEISKRFYEGLTREDVEGIRLIVEPKANPAILDAFPGEVVCVGDELLDRMLGDELKRDMGDLDKGGTVAHLCYYFARCLGCDPVIFIGQDLGFTDGQYYAAGAAIHQVWGGELSDHNTLEMMEWQRIVRMRGFLRERTDIHDRPIYLDEQMSTYLAQFEADFQKDTLAGRTIIDASEGGVRKQHTSVMGLCDALALHGSREPIVMPATEQDRQEADEHRTKVCDRLGKVIQDCERIVYLSEQTIEKLGEMIKHHTDQRRVGKLIGQVQKNSEKVRALDSAYAMCEAVNQVGVLNRMKRDRSIEMDAGASALDRQRLQIERDITNVQWTQDAAKSVVTQLGDALAVLEGRGEKKSNSHHEPITTMIDTQPVAAESNIAEQRECVHALVMADPEFGGLGIKRDLSRTVFNGQSALTLTLERLAQCTAIDGITIVTPDPDAIRKLAGHRVLSGAVRIVGVDPERFRAHASMVGSARVQSSECWRGSIGMLGVYDEQFDIGLVSQVMREHAIDACAIVGADWAMVDPRLVDETVSRYRHQDSEKRIAFSQAVPGIGTMVVDRVTLDSLAQTLDQTIHNSENTRRNHFATIGALVGYIPTVPQFDPIAKGMCVEIEPSVRDAGMRVIADSDERVERIARAFALLEEKETDEWINRDAIACVRAITDASKQMRPKCPRTIVLETCTGRMAGGDWGAWKRGSVEPVERTVLTLEDAHALLKDAGSLREDVAVVFDGVGDPLMHPQAMSFAQLAKEDGIACVELRTDLLCAGVETEAFFESGIDVLSVDVLAEDRATYQALTGQDRLEDVYDRLQGIFDAMGNGHSGDRGNNEHLWLVPRMTRCDAVYGDLERFYDKWLMLCGSAVIDPMSKADKEQRIKPLPIPAARQRQLDRETMRIRCDGAVVDRFGQPIRSINVFELGIETAYKRMCEALSSVQIEHKASTRRPTEEHAA